MCDRSFSVNQIRCVKELSGALEQEEQLKAVILRHTGRTSYTVSPRGS